MTEDMPIPLGGAEPPKPKFEIVDVAALHPMMYKLAVDQIGVSLKDAARTASNALRNEVPLSDDELIELYDKTCKNLIEEESIQNQINKLFIEIQSMIEDAKKEQVKTVEEKDSFLDTVKVNKASIIAQWGRAGYVGMSLIGGAIGWFITYIAGLS